jgi:hypothetical protein
MFRRIRRTDRAVSLRESLRRFWREDAAQDLLEYALLTALLGLMSTAALSPVAKAVGNGVDKVEKKFKEHTNHGHEHDNNGQHKGWDK